MEVPQLTPEMIAEFPPAAVDFIRQLLKVIEAQDLHQIALARGVAISIRIM